MSLSVPKTYDLIETRGFPGYELLDSGGGRKLERFGDIVVDRPEPQALWRRRLSADRWAQAHAVFSASGDDEDKGKWRIERAVPESWPVALLANTQQAGVSLTPNTQQAGVGVQAGGSLTPNTRQAGVGRVDDITMLCRLQGLWHLGLFPEQMPHWQWMLEKIAAAKAAGVERPRVLNLFGYTGAASLLAAAAGAEVVHVDASKKAIQWGKDNQAASKLNAAPIRWMLDDARKFTAREVRRGRDYHVLLVDPPKFGRGPKNETWELFADLPALMDDCAALAADKHAAIVLTVYAIRASALAFAELVAEKMAQAGGSMEVGELAIRSKDGKALVPTSLFVRWSAHA
ncbi:MAG: class I SAM-dependent methyltransferase [Alphaproteobacteria bacterium]|nr:class I SAM-dependent methyltransferase [Alphaproteobacteria bacterium]